MTVGSSHHRIRVPEALAASYRGDLGQAWVTALPVLAESFLDRWDLRLDGPPAHGVVALVLPVIRADGSLAMLKLQPVDEETRGEPLALRVWSGRDAVRLLDSDPDTGTMLLERLDASRSLAGVADDTAALQILSELLARLVASPAPAGLSLLADTATAMLDRLPHALRLLDAPADRQLLASCAAAVREVLPESGDRLLHWDLHYDNVLAQHPSSQPAGRTRWLAIDPKPLAGHPGFELLPALRNRWDDVVATGNVPRAVGYRFHLMTEVIGLDRRQATAWTLGRVLQNALWDIEDGAGTLQPEPAEIARALLDIR
ncbi:hydroxyurea phosphotransferase [Kitasatospora sp. MMS16-BH015]|uniref:aminoglycoside phosphotransferase family protein n=1 Tax=Kitasatospora sp. MMS16-BH015 TaxID=2018025 RepID=UPI000CA31AEB|nr:aminoglycoside phosphotransferase family protein [Kitasatospora sp. MMS16-BH015]AUG76250.1 hydroxyurea phosphotransferase [Kitasatospora sp. MMS16-BH015]